MRLYLVTYFVDNASYNVALARSLDEAETMATAWLSDNGAEVGSPDGFFEAVLIEPGEFVRSDFVSVFRV
jgi:hypothetical protein